MTKLLILLYGLPPVGYLVHIETGINVRQRVLAEIGGYKRKGLKLEPIFLNVETGYKLFTLGAKIVEND